MQVLAVWIFVEPIYSAMPIAENVPSGTMLEVRGAGLSAVTPPALVCEEKLNEGKLVL